MSLPERLTQIQEALASGRFPNEASVSMGVVLPILQALEWPIFNPEVVCPEYALQSRRVDFALCYPNRNVPKVFIEVKQVGQSEGADKQLFEYAFHVGVPMAVLTDGQEWHFYLPGEPGMYHERRVYKLDLLERDLNECEDRLMRYLSYQNVRTGDSIKAARRDHQNIAKERQIERNLPIAWEKLIEEKEELLVELIADKVESLCGYKPDEETVHGFLGKVGTQVPKPVHQGIQKKSDRTKPRTRRKIATQRLSAWVDGNELHVAFQNGPSKQWTLPERANKTMIRKVRDEAVSFAARHGATKGQQHAVMKALTKAEYWLTK